MRVEEEANIGKRRTLQAADVKVGDTVMVDDGLNPEKGTVETASDGLVRVVDDAGSPIAVIRPDAPTTEDPQLYTATPDRDAELESAAAEMGRLIKRTQADPQDKNAMDALRRIRNGPEFAKLPAGSRDLLDDHFRDVDRKAVEAEAEVKTKAKADEERRLMLAERSARWEKENAEREAKQEKERADRETALSTPSAVAGLSEGQLDDIRRAAANSDRMMFPQDGPKSKAVHGLWESQVQEIARLVGRGIDPKGATDRVLRESEAGVTHRRTLADMPVNNLGEITSDLLDNPAMTSSAEVESVRLSLLPEETQALKDSGIEVSENGTISMSDAELLLAERYRRQKETSKKDKTDHEGDAVAEAQAEIDKATATIARIEEQDAAADAALAEIEAGVSKVEDEAAAADTQREIDRAMATAARIKAQGAEADASLADIESGIEKLEDRDAAADLQRGLDRAKATVARIAAQDDAADARLAEIEAGVEKLETEVITAAGRRVKVAPEIVEAESLVASHDAGGAVNPAFPQELQPRDRSRKASQAQVHEYAADLKPELLMPTAQASEGAPIISADDIVESGNARTLAIKLAYEQGGAEGYRKYLAEHGYDVEGFESPMLVQRRTKDMTLEERAEFTREANARTTADRGAAEVASADAESLSPAVMSAFRGGKVVNVENQEFVRQFIDKVVPSAERASMMTADGELSQQGVQRIENAMFMGAYGEAEILERLREDTDSNIRGLGGAMIDVAPAWAAMRGAAKEGRIDPNSDMTQHLVEAVNTVRKSRSEGTPIEMLVGQTEMFSGEAIDPLTERMLQLMYRDPGAWEKPLSRERMVAALKSVVDQANKTTPDADMFGETTDVGGMLGAARTAAMEGLRGKKESPQLDALAGKRDEDDGEGGERAGEDGAGPKAGEDAAGGVKAGAPEGQQDAEPDSAAQSTLVKSIAEALAAGGNLNNPDLFKLADGAFGGTVGEGRYDPQDAYNAVEVAVNQIVAAQDLRNATPATIAQFAESLEATTLQLPTQTRRTGEKIEFQQFSTPPAYALAANYAAAIRDGEAVLEPSAGNGGLAVVARSMGANVAVNEISESRAAGLRALGFAPTTEDAEQIANILEPESFDTVVMNPPFSAAGARGVSASNAIGARHVSQALKMLRPGGRLVAIMGAGFTPENSRVSGLFKSMAKSGQFRAIVKVDGRVYRKYGTTFDNQLIVYDKTGEPGNPAQTMRAEFDNIPDLLNAMEGVHDGRPLARNGVRAPVPTTGGVRAGVPIDTGVSPKAARRPTGKAAVDPGLRDQPADGRPAVGPVRANVDQGGVGTGSKAGKPDGGPAATSKRADSGSGGKQRSGDVGPKPGGDRVVEEEGAAFSAYRPSQTKIRGAQPHPANLVESTAMASVNPPPVKYAPSIPDDVVSEGRLSDAQLETITYAGNAHSKTLPDGRRRGFFIGDGTGVGKGREIAGIIMDNWRQGRRRAVWVSKDKKLLKDAKRDVPGVGLDAEVHDLTSSEKTRGMSAADGIAFTTYSNLRSAGTAEQKRDKVPFPNVTKIADWLGKDFDGVVAFDESHVMANIMPSVGGRGRQEPSQVALAGAFLSELLPNARIVYVSATGATEVTNLGYLDRLGLWGEGTAFSDVHNFIAKISAGGVATMELVARDMKQMGSYSARSISFNGVEYDNVTHTLSGDQREMYDVAARAWQLVFNNIDAAIEVLMPGSTKAEQSKNKPMSYFWGANQRFFNQFLTSLQMPSVIKSMEKDLKQGLSPVLQLTNTNEAATNRAIAQLEKGQTLDDLDITPRQVIIDFVAAAFPTQQMHEVQDESGAYAGQAGHGKWVPVTDSQGNPVHNPEAVAMRDDLIAELAALQLPGNPLDMVLEHFGTERIAEVTGRSKRVTTGSDGKKVQEGRSKTALLAEIADFQESRRDILIFSAAGGTGASYHSDITAANQKRRSHYVLQAGWKADEAIQGFGRTHRSNQANEPIYRLVQTDLPAHKRFVATIARRLDQLGALTKGQREASSTGLFSATDNLENQYAQQAAYDLFAEMPDGDGVMSVDEAYAKMGIKVPLDKPLKPEDVPVSRFLNRLLSLEIEDQHKVFEAFADKLTANIQSAMEEGSYEVGVETYKAEGATILDRQTVHEEEETGAKTEYIQVEVEQRVAPIKFNMVADRQGHFARNRASGKLYFMEQAPSRTDASTGRVEERIRRWGAVNQSMMMAKEEYSSSDKYEKVIDRAAAKKAWDAAAAKVPATRKSTVHLLSGALLPVYDRIVSKGKRVNRIVLNNGESLLGRVLSPTDAQDTLANFGKGTELKKVPAADLISLIRDNPGIAELTNGATLRESRVSGESRIEVTGLEYREAMPRGPLGQMGFQIENIGYRSRVFLPNGPDGAVILDRYLKGKDILKIVDRSGNDISNNVRHYQSERTPEYLASNESDGIREDMEEILARLVPGAKLETPASIPSTARGGVVTGLFEQRDGEAIIRVALQGDPRRVLRHEVIHALKNAGLFTPAEWSALINAATRGKWLEKHRIKQRYPGLFYTGGAMDGKPKPAAMEEAIADEFASHIEGRPGAGKSMSTRRQSSLTGCSISSATWYRSCGDTARRRRPGTSLRRSSVAKSARASGRESHRTQRRNTARIRIQRRDQQGAFKDEDTEARWTKAAKGVTPSNVSRITDAVAEEWRKLTRARQHMPEVAQFSDAREKMIHLEQGEHIAKERIAGLFEKVMGGAQGRGHRPDDPQDGSRRSAMVFNSGDGSAVWPEGH